MRQDLPESKQKIAIGAGSSRQFELETAGGFFSSIKFSRHDAPLWIALLVFPPSLILFSLTFWSKSHLLPAWVISLPSAMSVFVSKFFLLGWQVHEYVLKSPVFYLLLFLFSIQILILLRRYSTRARTLTINPEGIDFRRSSRTLAGDSSQLPALTTETASSLSWAEVHSIDLDKDPARGSMSTMLIATTKSGQQIEFTLQRLRGWKEQESLLRTILKYAPDSVIGDKLKSYFSMNCVPTYTQLWIEALNHRAEAAPVQVPAPNTTLGTSEYRVIKRIATGGQSTALLCSDRLDQKVLVRLFGLPRVDARFAADSLKEMEKQIDCLRKIKHHSIASFIDFFLDENNAYLVMEYVEGENLRDFVSRFGALPQAQAINIALQICDALVYLHGRPQPIVHGDLTPDNMIINAGGELKLIDFNFPSMQAESKGFVAGKKAYMPIEQLRGKLDLGVDLYSLGASLFFLLTGEDPLALEVSHPAMKNAAVSEQMDALVSRLTAKTSDSRIVSAAELKTALNELSIHAPVFSGQEN